MIPLYRLLSSISLPFLLHRLLPHSLFLAFFFSLAFSLSPPSPAFFFLSRLSVCEVSWVDWVFVRWGRLPFTLFWLTGQKILFIPPVYFIGPPIFLFSKISSTAMLSANVAKDGSCYTSFKSFNEILILL